MKQSWAILLVLTALVLGLFILISPSESEVEVKPAAPAPASTPTPAPPALPVPKQVSEHKAPLVFDVLDSKSNKVITFGELMDRLNKADFVCVGEQHDSDECHRIQLQIIKALFARDERIGVGMEMFQKPYQSAIDRYFAGLISEEEFLKDSDYAKRWGFDWKLYRPIVEFCRRNDVPLAALNVRSELVKRLYKVGFDGLTDEEKKELGPIDFNVKAHKDYWYERLAKLHGLPNATKAQKDSSYAIMTAWDDFMAQNASAFRKERKLQRMVVLAGIGHVAGGFGIPNRAAAYAGGASVATVSIAIDGTEPDEEADASLKTDYVIRVHASK
jgi:uncharacterized iron-regulated protein